ncbi:SusC/RagA family TonB-linked outer membrane protein [Anaerophaga thermohalophila]|uniref:SusC/RagA family TonB-linked outer membrane protein n=1 Tax=Anaerophaga thermohalophila TaxID=177400 RepID=UPI000237C2D6|nr:TonB-dependent receptor [Anaerophaga thermohalophila]
MKKQFNFYKILFLFLGLGFFISASAQEKTVTGTVTEAGTGEPLPGVTVVIKGTQQGAISRVDGTYSVQASPEDVLVFSFIGFRTQEQPVGDREVINVTLEPEILGLDEVVVIGYGTVRKGDATGSVDVVSSKDFNRGSITTAQELMVGKSAGAIVTPGGGAPGSGSTIRIRGGSSLNASNDPLIIVDGVPLDNNNVSGSNNFLSVVNPNDIESFTVLKDASSTAIYGSRASNGVILIETKSAKEGAPLRIDYNVRTSIESPIEYVDVFSGDEMRQIATEKSELFGVSNLMKLGTYNTNWQEEIFHNAFTQDHNLSFSGAYKVLPYRVSVGYTNEEGILKNTDMERFTGSLNLNPSLLNDNLKLNFNVKGMITDHNFGDEGAIGSAVNMDPTQPIKDGNPASAGYFQWENYGANLGTPNPVEQALEVDNKSTVKRVIANLQADYTMPFLPDLRANLNVATDRSDSEGHNNRPITTNSQLDGSFTGRENTYNAENTNDLLDFYLNYKKDFGEIHNLDLTAGYSWQHFQRESDSYTRGLIPEGEEGYVEPVSSENSSENYLVSFFGRLNYTLMDKYLLTATFRDDGSSRFEGDNQWGFFPSVALAWKINQESFLENFDELSELKLRLSWGITGQQDIGSDYPAQATYIMASPGSYYPIGGVFLPTLRPNAYDPDIKWEETTTQNIGLDFGFFNNRVAGSVDVYKRETEDLLNTVTIPTGSNFSNQLLTNVGSLKNEGVEVALDLVPLSTRDMSLNVGFNLTYNENTITKLLMSEDPNYIGILYGDAFTGQKQVTRVGETAYSFFVNKQVYYQNGKPIEGMYVDLSGQGGTVNGDNDDKYIYNNPVPDYLLGLSLRFNYKNFDISASGRASFGNYVYNQVAAGSSYDQMQQIGYWKNFPRVLDEFQFVKRQFTSDYFVQDASFFKLDNVSVGYNFENVFKDISAYVNFTAQNIWTITDYDGIDPEVNGGIDNNFYPRPQAFILGINISY